MDTMWANVGSHRRALERDVLAEVGPTEFNRLQEEGVKGGMIMLGIASAIAGIWAAVHFAKPVFNYLFN